MPTGAPRKIFLNLPVKDLDRAVAFFTGLGFAFNPDFTDENATCMIVSEDAYVMLLKEPFFQGFTPRAVCDTATHAEALVALSAESRAEVDELTELALATGGARAAEPQDHGFMYARSFLDPDGHHWEVVWMDGSAAPS